MPNNPVNINASFPPSVGYMKDPYLSQIADTSIKHPMGDVFTRDADYQPYTRPSVYDKFISTQSSQRYLRGTNQPWYDRTVIGSAFFAPNLISKVAQTYGTLIGGAYQIGKEWIEKGNADVIKALAINPVNNILRQGTEAVEHEFPIYTTREYDEGNVVDKLANFSQWFAKDFADGAAFMASAWATSMGVQKVFGEFSITKALEAGGKSKAFTKVLSANAAKILGASKEFSGLGSKHIVTSFINTAFEASSEGYDTYKQVKAYYDNEIQKIQFDPTLSDEVKAEKIKQINEVKEQRATDALNSTFAYNAALLSVTNTLLETKWFLGNEKGVYKDLQRRIRKEALNNTDGFSVDNIIKSMKAPSYFKSALKGIGNEAFIEENFQAAFQNRFANKYTDEAQMGADSHFMFDLYDIASQSASNALHFVGNAAAATLRFTTFGGVNFKPIQTKPGTPEDDASNAMFAAVGLSGPFSAKAAQRDYLQQIEFAKKYGPRAGYLAKAAQLAKKFYVDNVSQPLNTFDYSHTDENGNVSTRKSVIDPTTNTFSVNTEAFTKAQSRLAVSLEHFRAAEAAALTGDKALFEANMQTALSELAFDIASMGNYNMEKDEIQDIVDSMIEIKSDVTTDLGVTDYVGKYKQELFDTIVELQELHRETNDLLNTTQRLTVEQIAQLSDAERDEYIDKIQKESEERTFNMDVLRTKFYAKTRRRILDKMINDTEEEAISKNLYSYSPTGDRIYNAPIANRLKDLHDELSYLEDLDTDIENDESTSLTKRYIREEISRHSGLSYKTRELVKRLDEINEELKGDITEERRAELAKEKVEINKQHMSNVYLVNEANELENFDSIGATLDIDGKPTKITQYNTSDVYGRKVGAPRIYGNDYKSGVRATNNGKDVVANSMDTIYTEELSLDPNSVASPENHIEFIKEFIKKYGKFALLSEALHKDLINLKDKWTDNDAYNTLELLKYFDNLLNTGFNIGNGISENLEDLLSDYEVLRQMIIDDALVDGITIDADAELLDNIYYLGTQIDVELKKKADALGVDLSQIRLALSKLHSKGLNTVEAFVNELITEYSSGQITVDELPNKLEELRNAIKERELEVRDSIAVVQEIENMLNESENELNNLKSYRTDNELFDYDNAFSNLFNNIDQGTHEAFSTVLSILNALPEDKRIDAILALDGSHPAEFAEIASFTDKALVENAIVFLISAQHAYSNRDDVKESTKKEMLEKIDKLLKDFNLIYNLVDANIARTDMANQLYLDFRVNAVFQVFGFGGSTVPDKDHPLIKILHEILTKNGLTAEAELLYQKQENNLANLLGLLTLANNIATAEERKKIKDYITKFIDVDEYKLHSFNVNPAKAFRNTAKFAILGIIGNTKFEELEANPHSFLYQISVHNNPMEALIRLDIDTFNNNVTKDQADAIRKFITLEFSRYVGAHFITSLLDANMSYQDFAKEYVEQTAAKGLNLSQQQFLSVLDGVIFLHKNITGDGINMEYMATLSGVLGSGKSTMLGLITNIYAKLKKKGDTSRIVGTGHASTSAITINQHIDISRTTGKLSVELTAADMANIDVLIVDEAFALSNQQVNDLYKLVLEENKKRSTDNKIKVIFAGDMSQNRVEDNHILLASEGMITIANPVFVGLEKTNRATQLSSLNTIYRSNIPSITNTLMKFKDQLDPIPVVDTNASINSLQKHTKDAKGVIQFNPANLAQFIAGRDTTRSAVVVMNNNNEVQDFLAKLKQFYSGDPKDLNVKVLSYYDVQSLTEDEVYIMLNPNKFDHFNKNFETSKFNIAMYTSIGRARSFVGISSDSVVVNSTKIDDIDGSIDMGDAVKNQLRDAHNAIKEGFNNSLQRYFNQSLAATPVTPVTPEDTDSLPEESVEDDPAEDLGNGIESYTGEQADGIEYLPGDDSPIDKDSLNQNNPPPFTGDDGTALSGSRYVPLQAVTSVNIANVWKDRDSNEKVTGYIMATVDDDSSMGYVYSVIAADKNGTFFRVAVLTKEELNGRFSHIANMPLSNENKILFKDKSKIGEIPLDKKLGEIQFAYGSKVNYSYDFENLVPTDVEDLIMKWMDNFFERKEGQEPSSDDHKRMFKNGIVSKENIDYNNFRIHVITDSYYTNNKLAKRGFTKSVIGGLALIMTNYNPKSPGALPQMILLSQSEANTEVDPVTGSNQWYDTVISPIKNYRDAIKELESLFNDSNTIIGKAQSNVDKRLALGDGGYRLSTYIIDEFAKLGYKFGYAGVPLKDNAIDILRELLTHPELELNVSKLSDEDLNTLMRALDKVIRMLYSLKEKTLVIQNTSEAIEEAKKLILDNPKYAGAQLSFDTVVGKNKDYIIVKVIIDENGNTVKQDVQLPIHSLGSTELQRAWKRLATSAGRHTINGVQLTGVYENKSDDNAKTIVVPKSLLGMKRGSRTKADSSARISWSGFVKISFRNVVTGDLSRSPIAQFLSEIDESIVSPLQEAVFKMLSDAGMSRYIGGNAVLINRLINHSDPKVKEAAMKLIEILEEKTSAPITSAHLDDMLNSIEPGKKIELGNGKFLRNNVKPSIAGAQLSNSNVRKFINDVTTNGFKGYSQPKVIVDMGESVEQTSPQVLEQYLKDNLGKERSNPDYQVRSTTAVEFTSRKDAFTKVRLESLYEHIIKNKIEFFINNKLPNNLGVTYSYNGVTNTVLSPHTDNEIFVHEFIHNATLMAINTPEDLRTPAQKLFVQRITHLQQIYDNHLIDSGKNKADYYSPTPSELNLHEFIASLSNKNFISEAKKIKLNSRKTLFKAILDAILSLFDLDFKNKTVYDATLKSLEDLINNVAEIKSSQEQQPQTQATIYTAEDKDRLLTLLSKLNNESAINSDTAKAHSILKIIRVLSKLDPNDVDYSTKIAAIIEDIKNNIGSEFSFAHKKVTPEFQQAVKEAFEESEELQNILEITEDGLNIPTANKIINAYKSGDIIDLSLDVLDKIKEFDRALNPDRKVPALFGEKDRMNPLANTKELTSRENINRLKESIKKDGFKGYLEVRINSDGAVALTEGNHRLQALKELGYKKVPVKVLGRGEIKGDYFTLVENGKKRNLGLNLKKDFDKKNNTVRLYRIENKNIPYDESREGIVSKKEIVGGFFTDNIDTVANYIRKNQTQEGINLVYVDISKNDLDKYHVSKNEYAKTMDVESDNWVIPSDINRSYVDLSSISKVTGNFMTLSKAKQELKSIIDNLPTYKITPQQKQQALDLYTDYIAKISLGLEVNPMTGEYNDSVVNPKDINVPDAIRGFKNYILNKRISLQTVLENRLANLDKQENLESNNSLRDLLEKLLEEVKTSDISNLSSIENRVNKVLNSGFLFAHIPSKENSHDGENTNQSTVVGLYSLQELTSKFNNSIEMFNSAMFNIKVGLYEALNGNRLDPVSMQEAQIKAFENIKKLSINKSSELDNFIQAKINEGFDDLKEIQNLKNIYKLIYEEQQKVNTFTTELQIINDRANELNNLVVNNVRELTEEEDKELDTLLDKGTEISIKLVKAEKTLELANVILDKYNNEVKVFRILSDNVGNIYQKTLRYIFHNWKTYNTEESEAGLSNEIQDNDTKNIMDSFSTSVKNYLILIPMYTVDAVTGMRKIYKFVPISTAIHTLTNLLYDELDLYDVNNVRNVLNQLTLLMHNNLYSKDSIAVLQKLKETLETYAQRYSEKGEDITPKDFTVFVDNFDSEDKFSNTFYLIEAVEGENKNTIDLRGMSVEEAEYVYRDKIKVIKYNSVAKAVEDNPNRAEDIRKLYGISKAYDDLSNIRTYLGSLARIIYLETHDSTSVKFVEGELTFSRFTKTIRKIPPGTTIRTRQQFLTHFLDVLSGLVPIQLTEGSKKITIDLTTFNITLGSIIQNVNNATNIQDKAKYVEQFLKVFGLGSLVTSVNNIYSKEYEDLMGDIASALGTAYTEINNNKELRAIIGQYSKDTSQSNYGEAIKAMYDSRAFIILGDKIANLAKVHEEGRRISAVRGTDGKLLMEFIPTDSYREMMKDYKRLTNKLRSRYFNSLFFQSNIFVNGINTIYDFDTRFLSRVSGRYHVPADRQTNAQRLQFLISDLFFTQISKNLSSDSAVYYQPLYQQGLSTKTELPKIKFLGINKIIQALDSMIEQLHYLDTNVTNRDGYNNKSRLNFQIFDSAKERLKELYPDLEYNIGNLNYKNKLIVEMLKLLMEKAKKYSKNLKESNLPLTNDIPAAYRVIRDGFHSSNLEGIVSDEILQVFKELIQESKLVEKNDKGEERDIKLYFTPHAESFKQSLYPEDHFLDFMMFAYAVNNYVNSYGLSQLAYGDFNEYESIANFGKRSQLAVSPGSLSLIDDKYGVPRYSNILLVNDVLTSSEEYAKLLKKFGLENENLDNILNQISKKNQTDDRVNFKQFERTDGTIFVTPRFYYKLQKGFGSGLNLKSTIKDQAFGWTEVYTVDRSVRYSSLKALSADYPFKFHKYFKEGIHFTMEKQFDKNGELKEYFYLNKIRREPVGLKNAMVVLDDAFIDSQENPESRDNLRKLRDFMDKAELPSIVPGGASTTLDMFVFNSSNKTLKPKGATLFDESGQFIENPTINLADHVIPMDMSLFKVQYNPYSTDTTTAVPRQILHFLSSIDNLEYADEAYTSLAALQNVIFQNVFGTGRIDEYKFKKILDESGARTNDDFSIKNALDSGLSLQHPTVMQKIVTSLGASLNKLASRVRLPGGKLILRSDIGFTFERKVGNKTIKDRLRIGKTVDGTPYAEASIPASFLSEAQKKALKSGRPLFIVPDMFGFRIPSGDLNAGLLIKVVDYYDEKNRGNLVILPAEEILKQGWDFDVDALFLLSFVSNKANYNGAFVTIEQDTPTGFTKLLNKSYDYNIKDSKQFETYEQNIIKEIQLLQKENNALIDKLKSKNTDEQTDKLDAKVKANRKTIKMLQRTRENTLKNRLIKAIINAYLDPSNNHRILDVTTIEIVQQSIRSLKVRGMYEAVKAEDLSDAMDNINMYSNVKESRTAIGIYAKGSGVTAYTRRASEEGDYPSIKNTFTFVNDKGKEILVKRIDPNITVFKTNNTSYSVNNKFLNAFLDALANPEIFDIAFTGANANLVDVGLSLNDVPFEAVLLLMNNPIIRDAVRNNTLRKLVQAIDELVYTTDEKGDKTYIPEYKRLKISLKDLSDANRKTKDSTLFENLVKDQSDTLLESETSDNDSQDESIDNVSTDKQTTVKEELAEANSKNEETTVNDTQIIKERIEQSHAAKQQAVIQSLSSMDKNSSIAKTLFLLHKLHSISQQKQKLIQLVNLPQDKPVSIADIFNFKIMINEVFPISVQKALVIKFRNIPEMHTAEQFTKYVKKIIEEIREEHRGHIILPSMEIDVEKILDNNPHIAVALIQTLTHIDNLEKQFAVLSDKAVKIVNSNLPQSDKVFLDTGTRKFYGLMLLSDLITSVQASDIIDYEVVQYLKSAKTNPKIIETRGVAAFINDTILMLEAVYRYENIQASTNPNFKRNLLLQKLMWTSGLLPQIKTTESISVQSFEAGDYHKAFMALGHYELTPETNELGEFLGYKVTYARNRQDSPLLRNLTKYAILKYGLRGGSSNYINAIEPTYLAKMSTALNRIFDTYITNNRDISGITSLFALKVAHEYPNSVVDLGVYSKKESVTTSFTKEGKFALATIIEEFDRTGIEYDVIVREDNNNFPTVMAIPSRHRSAKPQFFMFITTVEINGQTIAIYQKTKYGDVILSPYPYNTVDHFRIDKPTIKFQTSLEFDIHSTTQIDENGNEVPNVFEYPYEEKFLKDKVKEYVYGTYYNDVVRHSVSLLKILNMDSYKEDGVLKFQVIETDIANKDYDPDTGTYVQKHTQKELNLQHYNDLKKFFNYGKRNSDRFPTQLELTENDVVVYITNSKNIPISSQAQRIYGSSKRMNTINVKDIRSKGYVEIGKPNQIVKGPVGYGYGLPLNYVPELNVKREDGSWEYLTETSYGQKKTAKAFVALIDAANNNPDKKFIVTINSSSNFKKLTPGELAKIFISTGRAIPFNIVFNESFYNIMELEVKTLDDKKKKAVFGDKVDVNALSEIDILTELSKDETAKKADEIEDDCAGGNKAEYGMSFGFTPGSQWEIVKDLKGPSHAQGGIDLSIDNGMVMFSDGKTKYHANNGLVLGYIRKPGGHADLIRYNIDYANSILSDFPDIEIEESIINK